MEERLKIVLGMVTAHLEVRLGRHCGHEEHLFTARLLDSAALMETVAWIEERFAVTVQPHEVTLANFDTPLAIARLVDARLDGS